MHHTKREGGLLTADRFLSAKNSAPAAVNHKVVLKTQAITASFKERSLKKIKSIQL
ncbi:hypothetical protein [Nostoc sp. FACHB-145]|uniref:hypothetical protein n=1 Tax=Nostoc sp. FACHB-145 TaxID=2692836 RepID=UPI001689FADC|nr:hypothetical protein [Nostoc sp. FACHB-145]MBD2471425.1 hypothetical protein [Nostoc sp. FACHB-145]